MSKRDCVCIHQATFFMVSNQHKLYFSKPFDNWFTNSNCIDCFMYIKSFIWTIFVNSFMCVINTASSWSTCPRILSSKQSFQSMSKFQYKTDIFFPTLPLNRRKPKIFLEIHLGFEVLAQKILYDCLCFLLF